jgi:hypothetical protein
MIKMMIEVDCEDCAFSLDDPASVEWFAQQVLMNQTEDGALYLHSNEVGDTVGRVRVLVVQDWPPRSDTPNAGIQRALPASRHHHQEPEEVTMKGDDYVTAEQRLNPEQGVDIHELMRGIGARLAHRMDARREELRARGRLIIDPACTWRPTPAAQTDLRATFAAERERLRVLAEQAERDALAEAGQEPIWQTIAKIGASAPAGTWDAAVAPPARQPLTDEEIDKATAQERDALLDHIYEYGTAAEGVLERTRKLCRAVERKVRGK